jgi:hypothetical protein
VGADIQCHRHLTWDNGTHKCIKEKENHGEKWNIMNLENKEFGKRIKRSGSLGKKM